jgi:excisionase family DNA binding protein
MFESNLAAPAFLTVASAAERCQVSLRTMRRWLRSGLGFHQVAPRGKVLIRPQDLDAFLVRRQAASHLDADIDQVYALITRPGCGR